jgi:hypothetical protein
VTLEKAMSPEVTQENLRRTAEQIGRIWLTAKGNEFDS